MKLCTPNYANPTEDLDGAFPKAHLNSKEQTDTQMGSNLVGYTGMIIRC